MTKIFLKVEPCKVHDFDNYGKCCECGKWRHQVQEEYEDRFQKSPCCNGKIRATIEATARIEMNFKGVIENTNDEDTGEVNMETLYCEKCGEDLGLVDGKVQRTAQVLPKEEERKCAHCGADMYAIVRVHHHTEEIDAIVRVHHHTEEIDGVEQDVTGS